MGYVISEDCIPCKTCIGEQQINKEMKKNTDFSVHFTTKGQSIDAIRNDLLNWFEKQMVYDFSVHTAHHCFLPLKTVKEKGWSTDIYDKVLSAITDELVCWNGTTDNLEQSRFLMLQNLKRVGGVAVFVGEIKDGVKEELELAEELGVEIIIL